MADKKSKGPERDIKAGKTAAGKPAQEGGKGPVGQSGNKKANKASKPGK